MPDFLVPNAVLYFWPFSIFFSFFKTLLLRSVLRFTVKLIDFILEMLIMIGYFPEYLNLNTYLLLSDSWGCICNLVMLCRFRLSCALFLNNTIVVDCSSQMKSLYTM